MLLRSRLPLLALALAALGLLAFAPADTSDPLEIGATAPMTDAEMMGTDGKMHTLASSAGENGLLVMFTCNTCPWVKAWEDRFNAVAEAATEQGVGMIAVNPNAAYRDNGDSMDDMKARAEEMGYTFTYAVDENHALADAFGATRTPEVFLFDADMTLVYHGAIDDSPRDKGAVEEPYVMEALAALVSDGPVAEPVTKSIGCSIKRVES
jgi:peroxiredoxin